MSHPVVDFIRYLETVFKDCRFEDVLNEEGVTAGLLCSMTTAYRQTAEGTGDDRLAWGQYRKNPNKEDRGINESTVGADFALVLFWDNLRASVALFQAKKGISFSDHLSFNMWSGVKPRVGDEKLGHGAREKRKPQLEQLLNVAAKMQGQRIIKSFNEQEVAKAIADAGVKNNEHEKLFRHAANCDWIHYLIYAGGNKCIPLCDIKKSWMLAQIIEPVARVTKHYSKAPDLAALVEKGFNRDGGWLDLSVGQLADFLPDLIPVVGVFGGGNAAGLIQVADLAGYDFVERQSAPPSADPSPTTAPKRRRGHGFNP